MNESLQKDRSSSQPLHQHHLQHQYHDQYFGQLPAGGRERHSGGRVPGGLPRAGGAEAERVATTSQPTPMSPSHKPLMISQPRRTRLAGLTLHVCRFRAEESAHAASRRERPQNAPRHRGRPTPWAQGRDGFGLTTFHKSHPSNSCPTSALTHGPLCGPGCRFLRCYGYRRVFFHGHLGTLEC